ncbi:MAG: glycosyltransferase [Rhizomicrobium sp.]
MCFLIPGFGDGGAQKQCIYLLNELQSRDDVAVDLIHFHPGTHDHLLRRDKLRTTRIECSSNYDPRNILKLAIRLHEIRPDILFSWLHACDVYAFFAKRSVKNMTWLMAERDSDYPADLRYWIRRHLGRHADGIVSNSEMGAEYWQRAGATGRQFVIPNIVYRESHVTKSHGDREKMVIFAGRLEAQKNVVAMTYAFCRLAQDMPDWRFLLLGEGSLRTRLEEIVSDAGIGDRVRLLGFRRDIASYLARARLVVSLSHHEGLPNTILESIASGVLVVASDIPEHRALLGAEYPYYVRDRDDVVACTRAIQMALYCNEAGSVLSHAQERIDQMAPENVVRSYMEIFNTMAERPS